MSAEEAAEDAFWRTAGGKMLAAAQGYIHSAFIVRTSNAWLHNPMSLARPVAHLVGHGLELFLKFPHLASGASGESVGAEYRHNLAKLWDALMAAEVRNACLAAASEVWEQASTSGNWPTEQFRKNPQTALDEAVRKLSILHSGQSKHALRYPLKDRETVPSMHFLIDAFGLAIEAAVQDPQSFYR